MNSTIAKLADEFEKMEKTIASQKKMIETLMPTGYVDTDTVKLHLNSVYGVMFGGRPSPKRCKLEDCSWDEINMYSSFGLADKMFEVGDTKKFRLADGSYLTARTFAKTDSTYHIWKRSCEHAEVAYFDLLNEGCTPQEARSVLPNSLKTEVVMTADLREWRHFCRMRCPVAAHPDMRVVANMLLTLLKQTYPVFFEDIEV